MKTEISKRLKLIKLYTKLPLAIALNMMLVLSFIMLIVVIVKYV